MKPVPQKGKMGIKKWAFRGKKCVFGHEKLRAGNQNRKTIWCKTQALGLKLDKYQSVKG